MKRRVRRKSFSRERFIMAVSSVLVLGTLTITGLWLGKDTVSPEEDYTVDLSAIENNRAAGAAGEGTIQSAENTAVQAIPADDLDYDPYFQETNSAKVENPDLSESESMSEGAGEESEEEDEKEQNEDSLRETVAEIENPVDTQALSTAMQPALTFGDSDTLVWPVVGNVLVNFSMDKTVFFPTLEQYKYNPAIIIQANEGDLITAAAAGKVLSVYTDPKIGNAVTMELGGGYEVTYGQLTNILVSEGSYVAMGDVIAEVASPTKYFSIEGTNVYFKLTKDGEPVNPMTRLG